MHWCYRSQMSFNVNIKVTTIWNKCVFIALRPKDLKTEEQTCWNGEWRWVGWVIEFMGSIFHWDWQKLIAAGKFEEGRFWSCPLSKYLFLKLNKNLKNQVKVVVAFVLDNEPKMNTKLEK